MATSSYLLKPLAPLLYWLHALVQRTAEFWPFLGGGEHSLLLPKATYSPWISDKRFREIHSRIRKSTLVDVYRCYEIWQLVDESAKAGIGDLIQIGVWRGGTGALIASQAQTAGRGETAVLCDTFAGVVKATAHDPVYKGGEFANTSKELVEALMNQLNLHNVDILQGIFPDQTAHGCQHRTFRFCHIDVDVYESARAILEWVWPRLLVSGIVVFDDYGFHDTGGITKLVNDLRNRQDMIVFANLNGHAVVVKRA